MREIKFRIFRPSGMDYNPDWEYIESVPLNKGLEYLSQSYGSNLMQYTGLKDKNGKEIYEGDIIKDNEIKGCVKFGEIREYNSDSGSDDVFTGFYVDYKDLFTEGFDSKTAKRYEIIGNIYENPNLLPTQSQDK